VRLAFPAMATHRRPKPGTKFWLRLHTLRRWLVRAAAALSPDAQAMNSLDSSLHRIPGHSPRSHEQIYAKLEVTHVVNYDP
jgi:hypothetical protein